MMAFRSVVAIAATAAAAAGCAFNAVQPGMSREQVVSQYGTPSRVVPLANGTRLQYSTQPVGQSAIMVDLDASGKVVSARQVLVPKEFYKIEPGKWTRADMEREFGRPGTIDRVGNWPGDIMTYRWLDADQPMFFWAYLDANNIVQRTAQGMEYPIRMNDN
jgi:hypothetical protein